MEIESEEERVYWLRLYWWLQRDRWEAACGENFRCFFVVDDCPFLGFLMRGFIVEE